MKRIGFAVLGLALALPAYADEWSKTYTISGKPDLRVETTDANLHVYGWDQNTIAVKVTTERDKIGDRGVRIIEHQAGDLVELEVRLPHEGCVFCINFNWKSHRVDVDIHLPRDGRVNLRTGDGKIELNDFRGEMELRSGDGSQELTGVDGKLRARAGDGHIRAAGRFDGLDLSTGDGRIEVAVANGSAVATSWTLQAGDGSVTLRVPGNFGAEVDLHTGDGHITLDMPVQVEGKLAENSIRGKLNGGGNLLSIHTGDGSIRLGRT